MTQQSPPEKTIIQNDTCTLMFLAILFTNQDVEATKMSTNRGMNKEDVIHIY